MSSARFGKMAEEMKSFCESEGITQSQLLRNAVRKYMDDATAEKAELSSFEIGKDLFGQYGSGQGDRSINRKHYVRDAIRAKRAR